MDILIISPFNYAVHKQAEIVKELFFVNNLTINSIQITQALPNEIEQNIYGKNYDVAYVDMFYNEEEINMIREHVTGRKQTLVIF